MIAAAGSMIVGVYFAARRRRGKLA